MTARVPAPFPYVGGKSRIAARVWQELGDPYSFLDPFMGSNAVLLARPGWSDGASRMAREIVGDLNGYVVNAYRSIQQAPDETARYAWWPSFHADLTARHRWLVRWGRNGGLRKLLDDPEYYNPKVAGWWLWGISNWISVSDFCAAAFRDAAGDGGDIPDRTQLRNGKGVQLGKQTTPAASGADLPAVTQWRNGQGGQGHRVSTPGNVLLAPGVTAMGRACRRTGITPLG